MTEVLSSPHAQYPSPSSSSFSCIRPEVLPNEHFHNHDPESIIINSSPAASLYRRINYAQIREEVEEGDHQLSFLAVFFSIFRKSYSLVGCTISGVEKRRRRRHRRLIMEIGNPTNVRHVTHVTFDRFNGFLGLPVEFEPQVPRRPPSARGNCVPNILLMMQRRLYSQKGLESEGIFRINPENGQEEYVREQLNNGLIPDDIDVHCLAGLIKAWFRELPTGVLDALSPEQIMQAQSEDECTQLVRLLPPTEEALLDWAINLMADVAQLKHLNKMNARNVAMVFAPNMTQMLDPLTAMMYAVRVMNFLKTLIVKTLREREDSIEEIGPVMQLEASDDDRHRHILKPISECQVRVREEEDPGIAKKLQSNEAESESGDETHDFLSCIENSSTDEKGHVADHRPADILNPGGNTKDILEGGNTGVGTGTSHSRIRRAKTVKFKSC